MVVYKYLLLMRPRSVGACPADIWGWIDYNGPKVDKMHGRKAWGEIYYQRRLTDAEVQEYELLDCGSVRMSRLGSMEELEK